MYQTCACAIHIYLHTLSAACALVLSSYINVCAGYMRYVKLYSYMCCFLVVFVSFFGGEWGGGKDGGRQR